MRPVTGSVDPTQLGLDPALLAAGFNLAGVLSAEEYDAQVPSGWRSESFGGSVRSAILLGTGGSRFFQAFRELSQLQHVADPLDTLTARLVSAAVAFERERGHDAEAAYYWTERLGAYADFMQLGLASGFGSRSRLGILLHREYGPWLAIRALVLTSRSLEPTGPDPGAPPCDGCPAPCASSCLGAAVRPALDFDLDSCVETTRQEAVCQVGCAARRACVVGPEHRYTPDAEAHHRAAAASHLGLPPLLG